MIAYLDTQVVARLIDGDRRLISKEASSLINRARVLLSPMVALEIEFLFELNRVRLPWADVEPKLKDEIDYELCSLPFERVAYVARAEKWTRDPFDRIIVAQARANGFAYLVSYDQLIAKHYQRTIW